ncbi:MAG: hypothetical protein KAQ82_04015, partial [Dehalococcoidia bacterium]|nr:hypothetical protein [Dehalococcoidia bacterium]
MANLVEPVSVDYLESTFSNLLSLFNIYPVCGSTIERVPVQNQGTYFCPRYQPFGCKLLIFSLAAGGFAPVTKGSLSHVQAPEFWSSFS